MIPYLMEKKMQRKPNKYWFWTSHKFESQPLGRGCRRDKNKVNSNQSQSKSKQQTKKTVSDDPLKGLTILNLLLWEYNT